MNIIIILIITYLSQENLQKVPENFVLTGSQDKTMKLWNMIDKNLVRTQSAHTDVINCLAIMKNGRQAASGSSDSNVHLWELDSGNQVTFKNNRQSPIHSLAFILQDDYILTGAADGSIIAQTIADQTPIRSQSAHTGIVNSLFVRGRFFASGGGDGKVRLWDNVIDDDLLIMEWLGNGFPVTCVDLTVNKDFLAIGTENGKVVIAHIKTKRILRIIHDHQSPIVAIKFVDDYGDNQQVATVSKSGHIMYYDFYSGVISWKRVVALVVHCAHISFKNQYVLIGGRLEESNEQIFFNYDVRLNDYSIQQSANGHENVISSIIGQTNPQKSIKLRINKLLLH